MIEFEMCFVMLCNDQTEGECLEHNLFVEKAKRFKYLEEIKLGDIGFLLNINKDELIGIFRACSEAQLHIEPDAWNSKYAAQVRVELISKLQRKKEAAYILSKTGMAMGQLKSGIPVPQYPVHGQNVGEKILSNFEESI
jgi:hypothetical protein